MTNIPSRFGSSFLNQILLTVLLIGLVASDAASQTTASLSLRVKVVDTEGKTIPSATVILNSEDTDQEISGITTSDGTVTIVNLQSGTYKVAIRINGLVQSQQSVTLGVNQSNEFTLALQTANTGEQQVTAPPDGNLDITEMVKSLRLGKAGRFARAFQYEYKLNEQPGSLLVGSGAVILKNPQDYLQQHTITFKYSELFPDRLALFKVGSFYLNKYPPQYTPDGDVKLAEFLCDDKPLITCLTKGGRWWQRALMGTTFYVSLSERAMVQQGFIVTDRKFGEDYQPNGGFTFDPAKLFPNATNWKSTFDDVQKIDKALAYLGASDAIEGRKPWKAPWFAAVIPKVDFKILSQFDFVKYNGVLIASPFSERSLNTWTFSWDLTRVIPDTKNRIDADAIDDVMRLKDSLGKEDDPPQKKCKLHFDNEVRAVKVSPSFSAQRCRELAGLLRANSSELVYESKDEPGKSDGRNDGQNKSPQP